MCGQLQASVSRATVLQLWQYLAHATFFDGRASEISISASTYNAARQTFAYLSHTVSRSRGGALRSRAVVLRLPYPLYDLRSRTGVLRVAVDALAVVLSACNAWATALHRLSVCNLALPQHVRQPSLPCRALPGDRCAAACGLSPSTPATAAAAPPCGLDRTVNRHSMCHSIRAPSVGAVSDTC